jgi:excisionase family DNA binding protein
MSNHRDRTTVMDKRKSTDKDYGSFVDPRAFGLSKAAYSVKETLEVLSIGRTTFYALVARGEITIAKLGKKSLVYVTDIVALLTRLRDDVA